MTSTLANDQRGTATHLRLHLSLDVAICFWDNDCVRNEAQHADAKTFLASSENLRHSAHPDDIRSGCAQKAALRGRFVRWPRHPCVCALRKRALLQSELVGGVEHKPCERR